MFNGLKIMRRLFPIVLILLIWTPGAHGAPLNTAEFPSLLSSLRAIGPLQFCREPVPLENREVRERLEKEMLLTLWDRAQVILWLKRATRYLPLIESMLKAEGLPDDLKFIPIAESALRPHAGSSKGAVGFWQFLPQTGRRNGLAVNRRIDERRNIFASTRAAIQYLSTLHRRFESWTLAAAAYNMGEEGLEAEIIDQETKDYYRLYLPLETQRYIFRILSVKLIYSNPARYGFRMRPEDCYTPLQFDRVRVTCRDDIPIRIIARAAQTDFKTIKDLNPEIRGYYLAPGSHDILTPRGAGTRFDGRYSKLVQAFLSNREEWIYRVKRGDNLSTIAEKFNVPLTSVLRWNKLDPDRPIRPGDRLIIYGKRKTEVTNDR